MTIPCMKILSTLVRKEQKFTTPRNEILEKEGKGESTTTYPLSSGKAKSLKQTRVPKTSHLLLQDSSESQLLGNPHLGNYSSTEDFYKGRVTFLDCIHHARYNHLKALHVFTPHTCAWHNTHCCKSSPQSSPSAKLRVQGGKKPG